MKTEDIRGMSTEEILEQIGQLKEERFRLGFQRSLMELENPQLPKTLRRDIARLKTILNERARGEDQGPGEDE